MRRVGFALLAALAAGAIGVVAPGSANAEVTGGIGGHVWFDRDRDRAIDPGESPRVGFMVTVHEVATGVDRTAVTNFEGSFRLDGLPLGTYEVTAPHDGYDAVTPSMSSVELVDSRPRSTYFPQAGARIWGRAWDDVNGDGVRQTGEPGRQVVYTLFGQSDFEGVITRTVTADADGDYEMWDLPSGTYQIRTTSPDGMVATHYRAAGSQWYTDSDFLGTTEPVTEPFGLWVAGSLANIDVGFVVS